MATTAPPEAIEKIIRLRIRGKVWIPDSSALSCRMAWNLADCIVRWKYWEWEMREGLTKSANSKQQPKTTPIQTS